MTDFNNEAGFKLSGKTALMAFQHLFAMLGATILVPTLTGMSTSLALISSGLGTLVFFFITKKKVPVYLGSSFAFLGILIGMFSGGYSHEVMGKVSIAIMVTGLMYFGFSIIVKFAGSAFIKRLFPAVVVGPVILCIGLTLCPTAFGALKGNPVGWVIAISTALTIIIVSVFGKGYIKMLPILIGLGVGYVLSLILNQVNFDTLKNASWIIFEPVAFEKAFGFYKHLAFDWGTIIAIAPIAIVTFMEHIGDIKTNGAVVGKDFFEEPGLHRTLMGDGAATLIAGFVGGPPNTTYGENTGVLALTKNYNPYNIALAAIFAVCLGVFSKFGGFLGTLPAAVISGASMILYGMIMSQGLKTLVDAKVDFTKNRNLIIAALILIFGLGMQFGGISISIGSVAVSPLAIATVIGILANLLLPKTAEADSFVEMNITGVEEISNTKKK